ncbi:MAG: aspartate/glutamate racemase family protein [Dongiaceae bacterium]
MPARVWYQSFVDPDEQAPYITRLQAALDAAAAPGFVFEVHGLTPPDRHFSPLTEFRCAAQTIRNALAAERAGYAAFVIGHFQEPGLLECRSSLGIPVIGLGEATLLQACAMARRLGLVTIDPVFIPWHEAQVAHHGLASRLAGVRAVHFDLPTFMRAFTDEAAWREARDRFLGQLRPLVAAGAEILIPAGGLPMLMLGREPGLAVDGAPVLNGIPVAVKAAETAIQLQALTGIVASRAGTYAKAPDAAIDEFLAGRW